MPKGYWIVHIDVTDAERMKAYIAAAPQALQKYGGRYLVRAGTYEAVEGAARTRNTIVEFPSYQAALDCWHSAEYQQAAALRQSAAIVDLVIIEGYEGPQP